jgi:hypothetical protein
LPPTYCCSVPLIVKVLATLTVVAETLNPAIRVTVRAAFTMSLTEPVCLGRRQDGLWGYAVDLSSPD